MRTSKRITKKLHTRKSIKSFEVRMTDADNHQKVNTLIDFDKNNCNNIKLLAVKKGAIQNSIQISE